MPITIDNDPINLLFPGDPEFKQSGPVRWLRNGWDLDRAVVPVRGKITLLDAFIDSLLTWDSWSEDGNMFLSETPTDDHKQFPTAQVTFIGKKGGVLPPNRNSVTSSLQQVSGIVFSDNFILTFGLPPNWQAKITYTSPTSRFVTWSRTPPNFDSITAPVPPEITTAQIASLVVGGIDYTVWAAAAPYYDQIVEWVLGWFVQRTVKYTSYEELVPDQYFRATVTQQILLLPIQEEIVS